MLPGLPTVPPPPAADLQLKSPPTEQDGFRGTGNHTTVLTTSSQPSSSTSFSTMAVDQVGDTLRSSSVVTMETYPEASWSERLVWAPLEVRLGNHEDPKRDDKSVAFWWPALRFDSILDFDHYHRHVEDKSYRRDLVVLMLDRVQVTTPVFCVEYLGRPLTDVNTLEEAKCHASYFWAFLGDVLQSMSCQPPFFINQLTSLPLEHVHEIYKDFHRAMDLTLPFLGKPQTNHFEARGHTAWIKWEQNQREGGGDTTATATSTRATGNTALDHSSQDQQANYPRGNPPRPAMMAAAASPNLSVAAVSVTDESMISSHWTPGSTAVAPLDRPAPAPALRLPTYQGWPESMHPLGDIPWKEAHSRLCIVGWSRCLDPHDGQYRYHFQANGPLLTLAQMQRLATERYGWKPPASSPALAAAAGPVATVYHRTPSPSSRPLRRTAAAHHPAEAVKVDRQPPSTNTRNYSFGFVWKHKLAPEGWKKVPPKGPDAKLFDFYYLRPHVAMAMTNQRPSSSNGAIPSSFVKGVDYFYDHWAVLDWCRAHNLLRDLESSTSTSTSDHELIASASVADDPSTYLEGMEEHQADNEEEEEQDDDDDDNDNHEEQAPATATTKGQKKAFKKKSHKKPHSKKKKSEATQRNYTFGVLWATHLVPQGWTMPRARGNSLILDYYYVRPGRSYQKGISILGEDFFQSTDQVLDWCRKNNNYPPSSSPENNSALSSAEEEDEDDSTKHAVETEDDHTIGDQTEYSTPGTRTKPQDPSLPLLRDDDDDDTHGQASLTDEDKYEWRNLWPVLQKLGWNAKKARNNLDDWHYVRPRRPLSEESEQRSWIHGIHYFTTPNEVIAHVKEMDRLERMGELSHRHDGDFRPTLRIVGAVETVEPSRVHHPTYALGKRKETGSPSDEEETVHNMVARKKAAILKKSNKKVATASDEPSLCDAVDVQTIDDSLSPHLR